MLGPSWVALFRQIPANLQDVLVMITATGAEIILQKILVMEQDYFVFRGRMSGSQDGGLVIIMPYDQISNVCFNKRMLEPEVYQIFGNSGGFLTAAGVPEGQVGEVRRGSEAWRGGMRPPPRPRYRANLRKPSRRLSDVSRQGRSARDAAGAAGLAESLGKANQPSKTTLLARLRARLAGQAKT